MHACFFKNGTIQLVPKYHVMTHLNKLQSISLLYNKTGFLLIVKDSGYLLIKRLKIDKTKCYTKCSIMKWSGIAETEMLLFKYCE